MGRKYSREDVRVPLLRHLGAPFSQSKCFSGGTGRASLPLNRREDQMGPRVFGALALASACVCVTASAAAEPQQNRQQQQQRETMRFRAMDTNADGRIQRREWRGSAQSFRVHDWNRDGLLSGDEVRPGATRPRDLNDFDPQRRGDYADWTAEAFAELDHNRDGRVTKDEWHYDRESWVRADRDRDNVLTRV